MKKKEQAVCICCNKPLKKRQKKFCSKACNNKWWNNHLSQLKGEMRKCPVCGKPFYYTPSKNQKFCSHECYIKHRFPRKKQKAETQKPKGEYRQCPVCGKSFYTAPSKNQKFCSHECYVKHRFSERKPDAATGKPTGEYRLCPVCGKLFYTTYRKNQKFCSFECYVKHRYPEEDKKPEAVTLKKANKITPVNNKRFQPQIDHDLSLEIGDRLLEAKLVLVSELSKYQELIYRQYSPFITTLLRIDLKSDNTNANMLVHERRNKR